VRRGGRTSAACFGCLQIKAEPEINAQAGVDGVDSTKEQGVVAGQPQRLAMRVSAGIRAAQKKHPHPDQVNRDQKQNRGAPERIPAPSYH
jgi:hypothetical protein